MVGPLPDAVVGRIIRMSADRLRSCYEEGRRKNPSLMGRVETAFVIDVSGNIVSSKDWARTDLQDRGVVACVTRELGRLSFPPPEGAAVTVISLLSFSPPEGAP